MCARIVVLATLALAPGAAAQVSYTIIARNGQQVPGEPPGVVFGRAPIPPSTIPYDAFTDGTIDAAGRVTLIGRYLAPQGPVHAIFRETPALTRIWYHGQPDPNRNNAPVSWLFDIGYFYGLHSDGAAGGIVSEMVSSAIRYGLGRAEPIVVPALSSEPIAPSSPFAWTLSSTLTKYSFNRSGEGVFTGRIGSSTFVVGHIDSQGVARDMMRGGTNPPNAPPFAVATIQNSTPASSPMIGADGTMAIPVNMISQSSVGWTSPWLYVGTSDSLTPVINSFIEIPGIPVGARLDSNVFSGSRLLPAAAIAPDGRIATVLEFTNPPNGFFGALLYGTSGGLQSILMDQTYVPGLAPDRVVRLRPIVGNVVIAREGRVAVSCMNSLVGGSVSGGISTVVAGRPGALRVIAKAGDPYGPNPALSISTASVLGINTRQDVLVSLSLSGPGVSGANNEAVQVYTLDGGQIQLFRSGDVLTVAPGDQRTIRRPGLFWQAYRNAQINDARQVVMLIDFTDNTQAVVRFNLPASLCRVDFDGSGGLSVQDVFLFLAAWFRAEPVTDFNASGSLDTQDIFDFLEAWFAGCL